MAEQPIEAQGIVLEALPSAMFRVRLETGHEVIAYVGGKMRQHFIRLLPGDQVVVAMSPYDLTRGRIIRRLQKEDSTQQAVPPRPINHVSPQEGNHESPPVSQDHV